MHQQLTFSQIDYANKRKVTRRDRFLAEMEQVVPWEELLEVVRPFYYKERGRGRPPVPLERMLRLYFLQQWFALADEALEDAVYDSQAFDGVLGIDLLQVSVPDATTLPKFRCLLEATDLGQRLLKRVNAGLRTRGLLLNRDQRAEAAAPKGRLGPRPPPDAADSGQLGPRHTRQNRTNPGLSRQADTAMRAA